MAEIMVRFSRPGFHRWPDAPPGRAYLGQRHRHLFKCQVTLPVLHDDREVEFHDLLDVAAAAFVDAEAHHGEARSCEMIAGFMANALAVRYKRGATVEVWEDGECGARVAVA